MLFAYNGGMWCANPQLLNALKVCPEPTAVLSDLYENPVQVNTQELFDMAQQRWQEQMNAWLVEYNQTSHQR